MSYMSDLAIAIQQANDCSCCQGWIRFCPSDPDKCGGCEVAICPDCKRGVHNRGKPVPSVSEVRELEEEV